MIMGHSPMPVEDCVGISDEEATGNSTIKNVSRKTVKGYQAAI